MNEEIRHEVFFEEDITSIRQKTLFLGPEFASSRFSAALFLCLILLAFLLVRAGWMQIWNRSLYQMLAQDNRLRSVALWPKRGIIYDRKGKILADNTSRFQISFFPGEAARQPAEWEEKIGTASRLLSLTLQDFSPYRAMTTSTPEEVLVADRVSYERAMVFAVALPRLPGFHLVIRPIRRYPLSSEIPSLSHLLGYVGKLSSEEYAEGKDRGYHLVDEIGKTGLEKFYEISLRGQAGERTVEVDARGQKKAFVRERQPVNGADLFLTIDADLQKAAERALKDGLRSSGVSRGSVIALDPRNGGVLALISWPAYDNNVFSGSVSSTLFTRLVEDENRPLFPRGWAGTYPSGSTVKIIVAAAALAEKVIDAHTAIVSTGGLQIGPWFFPDWKAGGHGSTNARKAIAWSVNTFFYTIGGGYESFSGLGPEKLGAWFKKFGLGEKTGLDAPSEGAGFVPSREWKEKTKGERWFVGDTYNLSIGQGDLLVTPIQVAVYTAAMANGGRLVVPHLVATSSTKQESAFISREVIGVVQSGMRDAVTYGSARGLADLPFAVSGKTGTAQWNVKKKSHAWFTGFAPSSNPEIVVTVLLEEGGEGSTNAVPVARQVLQAWWRLRMQKK